MGQSPEELNRDIAGTRQSLADDLDELQDKVSPSAVMERRRSAAKNRLRGIRGRVMGTASSVRDSARGTGSERSSVPGSGGMRAGAGSALSNAQGRVEGTPLGAGLVAFGAGMVLAGLFPASRAEASAASAVVDTAQDKGGPLMDEARSRGQQVGQDLKDSASQAAHQVKESASESAGRVQDEGQSAAESVRSQARPGS